MSTLKKFSNLKTRIATIGALLVFLAVVVVTATSLLLARSQMRDILGAEQYATLTGAGAYIDRDIDARKSLLQSVSEEIPEVVMQDPSRVQQFISSRTSLREAFSNVIAIDPGGTIIASINARKPGEALNVSERDYFRDTILYHEGVVSAPFKSRLSGKPVVLVTEPVTDAAGRLRFILGGSLDLSSPRIFGQLQALHPGKTGYLWLMTGDGTIILHPNTKRILQRVDQEKGGATAATASALGGFEGWTQGETKSGVDALLTYRRLRTNDWIVASVYPVEEAFEPFKKVRGQAIATALTVAVFGGIMGWLGVARLLRPLAALQRHVATLSDNSEAIENFNVERQDEFGDLSRAFFALSKKRASAEAALALQAMTDPLTGLSNRRMFDAAIAHAFARAERSKAMLAVAYLDIDHFKRINDSLGHGAGDLVLVEFARRLQGAVRVTDTVVRIAGDEFTVIFENFSDHGDPDALGRKIIDAMAAPMRIEGKELQVSASVGICAGATEGMQVADFIRRADAALYRSKQEGRGRYFVDVVSGSLTSPA
jgi:diguanylate cyclase (GGDEF)-like protein